MPNVKPSTCSGCPLYDKGRGFVTADGTGTNGVLLLGEAPGATEASQGKPFVGDAGYQLNRTLERTRMKRDDFRIFNTVNCQPPNNWLEGAPWEEDATRHCDQYLYKVVAAMRPKVIVPLGNVALDACLGRKGIEALRGYVYEANVRGHTCYVVPTYHPAFILRGQDNLTGVQIYDLQRAIRMARDGYRQPPYSYVENPSGGDTGRFIDAARSAADRGDWLACDIETPCSGSTLEDDYGEIIDTEILRVSFSYAPHTAITIPWTNRNLAYIQQLLQLPFEYVVFWNADFDVPRLQSKGVTIGPKVLDAMWMWHHLQSDLPKHLGFVSTFFTELPEWKSLSGAFPEFYSCRDADATTQCTLGIKALLEREHRFTSFTRHCLELDPILKTMGRSGVAIDQTKRLAFQAELDNELKAIDQSIQKAVPDNLRPFKSKRSVPSEASPRLPFGDADTGVVWDISNEGEWGVRSPFLYTSPKQVIAYMRSQGHPVPRHHKTQKDTTAKLEIERLAKHYPKDPLYPLILKARKIGTMKSTFVDAYAPKPEGHVDPDGRVRVTLTFAPSTGRLAGQDPNPMNIPKRGDLAKPCRDMFVASPGCRLVELDYKAMQAVIVGYLARDEEFIKAAKLGVHAILASHVLARQRLMPAPINVDAEYAKLPIRAIKSQYPKLYDVCKHVVYLSSFGGTPYRMKVEYPDEFPSVKYAEELQQIYFTTLGRKVRQWQHDTLQLAHRQCYLDSPFGHRHYFWNVFAWDSKRRQLAWGPNAKDALAFLPQAIERCVLTSAIQRVVALDLAKVLRWPIHDSLLIEVSNGDDVIEAVKREMERPVPELDDLSFSVEVSVGTSWGSMTEWRSA